MTGKQIAVDQTPQQHFEHQQKKYTSNNIPQRHTSYLVTPAGIFRPFTVIACVTEYCFNSSGLIIPNCNFFILRSRAEECPKLVDTWEREMAPASRAVPSFLGAMMMF